MIVPVKSVFIRHSIPDIIKSDAGPQFIRYDFEQFAVKYGFRHVTSSPKRPIENSAKIISDY